MEETSEDSAAPATKVALAFHGATMHYGEVAGRGESGTGTLRRLGSCAFAFDAAQAVFADVAPVDLDSVIDAAGELFGSSPVASLRFAVHPSALTAFFSVLPADWEEGRVQDQLRDEASLLADVGTGALVRVRSSPVRSEAVRRGEQTEAYRWRHVMYIPEPVQARLTLIARAMGLDAFELIPSHQAAVEALAAFDGMGGMASPPDPEAPYTLVLGAYPPHVELGILHDGRWFHGHHGTMDSPDDAAYVAVALLDTLRLGTQQIGRFLLYGEGPKPRRFGLLSDLLGLQPGLFDPVAVFGRTPDDTPPDVLAGYAPCVGALLHMD